MKLLIIQYILTEIILQSVAEDHYDLHCTAVYFTSAETEASNKTFHWLIAFHPNLTCPVVLHIFFYISLAPNFSHVFNFNFYCLPPYICALMFAEEHYTTSIYNQDSHKNVLP